MTEWMTLVVLLAGLGGGSHPAMAQTDARQTDKITLHVYGPGGPVEPMKESAALFSKQHSIEVKVIGGPESKWIAEARKNADIIFGGAQYMLTQLIQNHPGLVDEKTRAELYMRPAGILVRKGNPKGIKTLQDLTGEGIRIVDVIGAGQLGLWEDMAGAQGLLSGIQKNIALSVPTSAEAVEKWQTMPELDAWITFESWHYRLRDSTDLVRMPERDKLYRGTPIAVTAISQHRELSRRFIEFLQTETAHRIFQKWGWK